MLKRPGTPRNAHDVHCSLPVFVANEIVAFLRSSDVYDLSRFTVTSLKDKQISWKQRFANINQGDIHV